MLEDREGKLGKLVGPGIGLLSDRESRPLPKLLDV